MRRAAALVTVILAFTLIASVAAASSGNYKDQFSSTGYAGSDGSIDWSSEPWVEVKDDGSYETGKVQSLASGNCPQGSSCLIIEGQSLNLSGIGASRPADLSLFQSATLEYELNFVVDDLLTAAFLHIEGRVGGAWIPLRIEPHGISNGSLQGSISLPSLYLEDGFEFRFIVNGLLAGDVYIDDVKISGEVESTTTTTSTATTTTTLPTTTTSSPITTLSTITLPALLTSSTSTTTTTSGISSTITTTEGGSTTTSASGSTSSDGQTGSSGNGSTTTTSEGSIATSGQEGSEPTGTPAPGDGLREAAIGIQAAFDGGRFGDVDGPSLEVMGIAIEPNYSLAVEVIESSWIYLLVLILLIATAIVSGLDRRRLKRAKHTAV